MPSLSSRQLIVRMTGPVRRGDAAVAGDPSLVGHVGEVLRVVEERDGVEVGTEAQHLATGLHEPFQR
jgi:hypothetical protein